MFFLYISINKASVFCAFLYFLRGAWYTKASWCVKAQLSFQFVLKVIHPVNGDKL